MKFAHGLIVGLIVISLGTGALRSDEDLPAPPGAAANSDATPPKENQNGRSDTATPAENRPIFLIDEPSSLLRTPPPLPALPKIDSNTTKADAIAQLAQSNRDLLDLLQRQQATLEDLQYDRRLQSRQILNLELQLINTTRDNATLSAKIAKLQANLDNATMANSRNAATADNPPPPGSTGQTPPSQTPNATPPAKPASFIPPEQTSGPAGSFWWHRLATLVGGDVNKRTDWFLIKGRTWRVIWHNLDHPGDAYKDKSALFITAIPRNVSVPQKVCSALGTNGDVAELQGPGTYYLQIDASGGTWEAAVEDFKP